MRDSLAQYIGIPFRANGRDPATGWDCWGCARYVMRYVYDIPVPDELDDLEYNIKRLPRCADLIAHYQAQSRWDAVPMDLAQEGDVVLLRMNGHPVHMGLTVERGKMIHVWSGIDTCIESYVKTDWISRIVGIYRYGWSDNRA